MENNIDFNMKKASEMLSGLELSITIDNIIIDILWFRVMKMKEDWIIPRHKHSSYELHFVYSGKSLVILDSDEFIVSEGQFYVTGPGIYHEQRHVICNEYIEFSINVDFKLISNTDKNLNEEVHNILRVLDNSRCIAINDTYYCTKNFMGALHEAINRNIGYYNKIKQLLGIIIVDLTRSILEQQGEVGRYITTPKDYKKENRNDRRYKEIENYIKDNISSDLTIVEIANYMHLSEKQIYRIIKEKTDKNTKGLINNIKHKKAKELILTTEYSIKEISDMLGFSSEYYFNQFFKREEGYPPGIFRKNYNV